MAVQLPHHNYFPCVRAPFDLWAEEELTSRNAVPGAKRCKPKDFMSSAHGLFAALVPNTQAEYERRYLDHCHTQGVVPTTPATKKKKRARPAVAASSIQKKPKPVQSTPAAETPAEPESVRLLMASAAPVSVSVKPTKRSIICSIAELSRNITLEVEAEDTVATLKALLQDEVDIPADQQRLICAGKYLDDDGGTLRHCIPTDAAIHLVRRRVPSQPPKEAIAGTATGGDWTVMTDQASLLLLDWTAHLPKHDISLLFKRGVVCLGFSHSVQRRTVILNNSHSSCLVSGGHTEITKGVRVEIALDGEGCRDCHGDEVYRFQLQQQDTNNRRLKIKCFSGVLMVTCLCPTISCVSVAIVCNHSSNVDL